MHSEVVDRMLEQMDKDPWFVKLMRWIRLRYWIFYCLRVRPIKRFFGIKNY